MRARYLMIGIGLAVAVVVIAVSWDPLDLRSRLLDQAVEAEQGEQPIPTTDRVVLSPEAAAGITIELGQATETWLVPSRIITGRLDYDQTKHVMIRSAAAGVITKILVRPGESVAAGDVVAEVSSPEVGTIRAEISQRQAELELAKNREARDSGIHEGVKRLVAEIRAGATPSDIETTIEKLSLGRYRDELVSAYTRQLLATLLQDNISDAVRSGAIASKVQSERQSESQASAAALIAAIDQAVFDVDQQRLKSQAEMAKANRDLQVSLEKLKLLLGPSAAASDLSRTTGSPNELLSRFNLVSPLDGTVQSQLVAAFERVEGNQDVILVADTSHLWAVADVRESDWMVADVKMGDKVSFSTPLIPETKFSANVRSVGPSIDPVIDAMPLVAEVTAADRRLRPGMFIRVTVPENSSRLALTVPETAVAVHAGNQFVFVPDGPLSYRKVDVKIGETVGPDTEILAGLKSGDPVVITGTFQLQSELLLAGEGE